MLRIVLHNFEYFTTYCTMYSKPVCYYKLYIRLRIVFSLHIVPYIILQIIKHTVYCIYIIFYILCFVLLLYKRCFAMSVKIVNANDVSASAMCANARRVNAGGAIAISANAPSAKLWQA